MARHFANVARDRPRVEPDNLPGAIGILAVADGPGETVGIAFGAGHIGGWPWSPSSSSPRASPIARPPTRSALASTESTPSASN